MERAGAGAGGSRGRGPARGERGGRRFHYQYAGGRSGPWTNQNNAAAPEPCSDEGTRRGGYGRRRGKRAGAGAGGYRGRGPARGERSGRGFHYENEGGQSGPWMNQNYAAAPEPCPGEGTRRGGYGRSGGESERGTSGPCNRHYAAVQEPCSDSGEEYRRDGYGRGEGEPERGRSGPWNQNYAVVSEPMSGSGEETRRGGYGRSGGESERGTSGPCNRHYAAVQEPCSDSGEEYRRDGYGRGEGEPERGRSGPWNQNYAVVSEPMSGSGEETRRGGYARGGVERGNPERGRGRQGGRDGGTVGPPFRVVPDETITFDSPEPDQVPKPERLQVSEQLGPSSSCTPDKKDKILPVHRPDKGGKLAIQTCRLRVNHFPVKFNPMGIIMHYNVEVKPQLPQKHGRPQKIPESDLSMIRERLFSDDPKRLPLGKTAYDGGKNIFTAVPVPEETFTVNISKGEDEGSSSYDVTLTLVNKLKLHKLKEYLSGEVSSIPRDVLQGLDLVEKENPARCTISFEQNFYPTNPPLLHKDLQRGIIALRGFEHSLKPTSQGLSLCLDYSVLFIWNQISVLDFLHEHINGFRLNEFEKFKEHVKQALIGLKVNVTHHENKQQHTITRLTDKTTRDLTFPVVDRKGRFPPQNIGVLSYFKEKYGKEIVHKDIPCLDFGRGKKIHYVPMEFCILVEGQRYPKECLAMSLACPKERKGVIQKMVQSRGRPYCGGIMQSFGINVDPNMTTVEGRIIGPPKLKLGDPNGNIMSITLDPEKCHWNLIGKSMVEGRQVERWAILDFTSDEPYGVKFGVKDFVNKLIGKYRKFGIHMKKPVQYELTSMKQLADYDSLCQLLEKINDRSYKKGRDPLQFILCVMTSKDPGYKTLKWISETKVGIVTQCCLSGNANEGKDQYLTNLALKINAKLGGSNVELHNRLPHFEDEGHVMFIGADANHPAASDTNNPSISAVVASVNWPAANRYAARVCSQYHWKEKILNFGEVCLELVGCYERLNKVRPGKIVIFRDGVSEGQFDMVLNEELQDLKRAFQCSNYFPTITLIVAQKRPQKRPQTRLFLDGACKGNVLPGTVVDTKIIHPFEFDFYLFSHYGSSGTSIPTHYHVLWDEHRFTSDDLQKLIYDMCFTFARCTKPVSLVPPVYYARLATRRGRLYHEARIGVQSPDSASSSSFLASSSFSSTASIEQGFYRLHADLENIMFFI